ncbi:uncharacterized protein A1O5_03230 [Cladophialophora psammophila CBS 110553]|uniref:Uncharacterized protein n=1 Tax=Cladophialophora psammophila CBS 110553 TaxID=1182543 RepID=W9XT58_9EURO|nr:uncharacterized protein A1O5_03230 [Cladophialophora psammophila CBS 110553]EXJ73469.1 hypothetical protein A1O5_03230 [Cladophialophora psammophila CBS 110553]
MVSTPDVIVGIDFGMTSTGVAYSAGPEWMRPETIQNWPGNLRGGIADKVDSKIAYDPNGDIVSWGFMVDSCRVGDNVRVEELFKLYLDPDFKDPYEGAPSVQEAQRWFTDYLSRLHQAVERHLRDTIPRYDSKRVEFRFSVPTTWKNPAMIAETKQLIHKAGFGRRSARETVEVSLTEAEAAAVYASKQQYSSGDVFLVCDAGGGTSDVNILKVLASGIGETELEPLSWVEGRAIGSTLIDYRMEKLIIERLEPIREHLVLKPETAAYRMLRENSRFESFKCNLGDEAMDLPSLRLPIPGLPYGTNFEFVGVEDSQMIIMKEEVQAIFDDQVEKLTNLIDEQLTHLQTTKPTEQVAYMVLSGGLGSSPYLQKRLTARYQGGTTQFPNAKDLQILRVPKPQLAVCHGLVLDRVQQIKANRSVYKERYCRNSYGVVVRREYDPKCHLGQPVIIDPRDNKIWVEKQIDWFVVKVGPDETSTKIKRGGLRVEQGQKVSVQNGVKQRYSMKIQPGSERLPWQSQIVMSSLPPDQLPSSLNDPGAQPVCKVESQLPQDMKRKNRHWYNVGPEYLRAEFEMQVLIGPADLKFQTLSRDGVMSRDHESIDVEWVSSTKEASQPFIAELEGCDSPHVARKGQRWSQLKLVNR